MSFNIKIKYRERKNMKIIDIFIILVICMQPLNLFSQENNKNTITGGDKTVTDESRTDESKNEAEGEPTQTLVNLREATHSGYAAPFVRFTTLNDEFSVFAGGRAGWIINDRYVLGISGCGLATMHKRSEITDREDPEDLNFGMGYGGVILEYYFFPNRLIHISVGALAGAGGYGLVSSDENADEDVDHGHDGSGESFFVLEPELNLFLNVTKFFRIGIGGTYRYVNGVEKYGMKNNYLRDFSGQILLAFGWF